MSVEYRHSTESTWVTTSATNAHNRVADLDAHMKQWTDAGWILHSMSSAPQGDVYMGYSIHYVFIWQREVVSQAG